MHVGYYVSSETSTKVYHAQLFYISYSFYNAIFYNMTSKKNATITL
jgi:hypothetical protein